MLKLFLISNWLLNSKISQLETLKLLEVLVFFSDWGCQKAFDGEAPCNKTAGEETGWGGWGSWGSWGTDWSSKVKLIFS